MTDKIGDIIFCPISEKVKKVVGYDSDGVAILSELTAEELEKHQTDAEDQGKNEMTS